MLETSEKDIKVLDFMLAIRSRAGMYIGSVDYDGYHHLFIEAVSNSIDEYLAGRCNNISITLPTADSIQITDNGVGIPVEIHNQTKVSTLTTVFMHSHSGGKFGSGIYEISSGMNGIGIKCITALSEFLTVWTSRGGIVYRQDFGKGKIRSEVTEVKRGSPISKEHSGTALLFKPDPAIFAHSEFDPIFIEDFCRKVSQLCSGLKINFNDKEFYYEGTAGVVSLFNRLLPDKIIVGETFQYLSSDLSVVLGVNKKLQSATDCFVNIMYTKDGGSHLTALKSAFTDGVNELLHTSYGVEVCSGLVGVVDFRTKEPQYQGQHKSKYVDQKAFSLIYERLKEQIKGFLIKNATVLQFVEASIKKQHDFQNQVLELNSIKAEISRKIDSKKFTPIRLRASNTKDPTKRELYIVEGESAGSSAVQARNPEFQEILPLRGKILNSIRADDLELLRNNEIQTLIFAISMGILDKQDLNKLRVGKVILAADSDPDGQHIVSLLVGFFAKYMPKLIENGNLYIARTPLFIFNCKGKYSYANTVDECKKQYKVKYGEFDSSTTISRLKGLGELNYDEIKTLLMDKGGRNLEQITFKSSEFEYIFDVMSGKRTRELLVFET